MKRPARPTSGPIDPARRRRAAVGYAGVIVAALSPALPAQTTRPADARVVEQLWRAARERVLATPVGSHDLHILNLPDDFVRRIADREIRASYQERFHLVVRDPASAPDPATAPPPPADRSQPGPPTKESPLSGITIAFAAAAILAGALAALKWARRGGPP